MAPDEIRQLRKELDLTQQQFAERLGVSFVTLNLRISRNVTGDFAKA